MPFGGQEAKDQGDDIIIMFVMPHKDKTRNVPQLQTLFKHGENTVMTN